MVTSRNYKILGDFSKVSQFLHDEYNKQKYKVFPQPMLEYAQTHPCFDYQLAHRCKIWEEDGKIVGFVCFECNIGDVYLLADENHSYLYDEMLQYAEENLSGVTAEGAHYVIIAWDKADDKMSNLLAKRGYQNRRIEPNLIYDYSKGFEHKPLPEGYELITLEDENDFNKIDKCLWLGFDHGTEEEYEEQRQEKDIDARATMQTGPNFMKELSFVVKSLNGDYVCFASMWLDGDNNYAYLEPLATVPSHRGKGLATITLMEAMKATLKYGAKYCIGGSIDFYKDIGFEKLGDTVYWIKKW